MSEKIHITYDEIKSPGVDTVLSRMAEETALRTGGGAGTAPDGKTSLIHKSWFYLSLAGLAGALIAWAIFEPFVKDNVNLLDTSRNQLDFSALMLPALAGLVGLLIGSMEGILARNFSRALKAGGLGFLIGVGGCFVSLMVAGMLTLILIPLGVQIVGQEAFNDIGHHIGALAWIVVWRCLAWTVLGMTIGLGPGIALKAKKLTRNGFLGGMIGGAIGGMLFDPISYFISGGASGGRATLSRVIGFGILGATTGLMIGLVEMITKDSWLLMTEGPLKGKQFIIYRDPTIIGSSPKSEIYLFRDPAIEAAHASIRTIRDAYEIEDMNTAGGTWVNGQRIKRKRLMSGDDIRIGGARFIYSEKEKKPQKS